MMATLTSKYQITIPKPIRKSLGLQIGDKLDFVMNVRGMVSILPITASITQLKGMVPKPKKVASLEEMHQGIIKGATKK